VALSPAPAVAPKGPGCCGGTANGRERQELMSPRSPLPGRGAARWPILAGDERPDLLGVVAEDSLAGPGGGTVLAVHERAGPSPVAHETGDARFGAGAPLHEFHETTSPSPASPASTTQPASPHQERHPYQPGPPARDHRRHRPPAHRTRPATHTDRLRPALRLRRPPRPGVTRAVPQPNHRPRTVTTTTAANAQLPEPTPCDSQS
jgi:hypothetical protein